MKTNTTAAEQSTANPKWFREVLGKYPTGVCVVTAVQPDGSPAGMVVGTFTSVSLNPPLVGFLPDKSSTSWPKIHTAGKFCINVLGADQTDLCGRMASKAEDKFEGVAYSLTDNGSPLLQDVVAWIDCDLHSVTEAGDHYIVLGDVRQLHAEPEREPLIFCQGGYGQFSCL